MLRMRRVGMVVRGALRRWAHRTSDGAVAPRTHHGDVCVRVKEHLVELARTRERANDRRISLVNETEQSAAFARSE